MCGASGLSAEPLVGLKPQRSRQHRRLHPFSRTPRGFEAARAGVEWCRFDLLSAEPLVGLKRRRLCCRRG